MEILKREWFWAGTFSIISVIIGSLLTILGAYFKEKTSRSTLIKLEKVKIYDEKKYNSYIELYQFISTAFSSYWPPDDPEKDFKDLMKTHFFIKVKNNYPYFNRNIREKLKILETQYICLFEPDFSPSIPFDQFFETDYLKLLNELNINIEEIFDNWE